MPAAKTFQTARSAATSGRVCSAAWIVFFEADLEFAEGDPEVGDGSLQVQVAFEVFEGGARLRRDPGADTVALALGQRRSLVGAGLRFDRGTRLVQGFDRANPGPTDAEHLGDLAGGHADAGEGDHAMAELGGERFHRRHL